MRYRHVALRAGSDLRSAEDYYARLFGLTVVVREAVGDDATWAQLPRDKTWEDAEEAGVHIDMVALERDGMTLALFCGEPQDGRLFAIGLVLDRDEIASVAERLDEELVEDRRDDWLAFVDRFGIRWQLTSTGRFSGSGDQAGRWLDV